MNLKPEHGHEPCTCLRACKSLNSSSLLGMFAFAAFPCSLALTSVIFKSGTQQIWLASGLVGFSLPSLSPTSLQCPSWEATLKSRDLPCHFHGVSLWSPQKKLWCVPMAPHAICFLGSLARWLPTSQIFSVPVSCLQQSPTSSSGSLADCPHWNPARSIKSAATDLLSCILVTSLLLCTLGLTV